MVTIILHELVNLMEVFQMKLVNNKVADLFPSIMRFYPNHLSVISLCNRQMSDSLLVEFRELSTVPTFVFKVTGDSFAIS